MTDYKLCPTHGADCPGHFHVEIPAEGPGVVVRGDVVYMWEAKGTPARLPAGDPPNMDGWAEIGWIDEAYLTPRLEEFEAAYRKVEESLQASRRAMKTQAAYYLTATVSEPMNLEVARLFFGTVPEPKPDYPLIDTDLVKWTATPDNPKPADRMTWSSYLEQTLPVMPWQAEILRGWLAETTEYEAVLTDIRALTPPDEYDAAVAEVRRLAAETVLTRISAAELVRERVKVTGQPYSILNQGADNYQGLTIEIAALRQYGTNPYCRECGRQRGCTSYCDDLDCDHCYCDREGRDG